MSKDYKDIENVFFCYSLRVFHALKASGERYLYKDSHPVTGRTFWAFPRTENLGVVLTELGNEKIKYKQGEMKNESGKFKSRISSKEL